MSKASSERWEEAYLRFETPDEEIEKFRARLSRLGCADWPRTARVVELFCGRGNGLRALSGLGFTAVSGIDLSPRLVASSGAGRAMVVGDCRALPYATASHDVAIVQGGLHHLPEWRSDLARTLAEAHRILRPAGFFVAVEPWPTPFLALAHRLSRSAARRFSTRLDAFATMVEEEGAVYERWLSDPEAILRVLNRYFSPDRLSVGWGKLMFRGRPRGPADPIFSAGDTPA